VQTTNADRQGSVRAVTGGVRFLLRVEGAVILIAALVLYADTARTWWIFAAFLLTPDLVLLAYLGGPRVGAVAYNAVHSYLGPIVLAVATRGDGVGYAIALIWGAHCGMDRAAGYGLKYASAFGHTHLGKVGRASPAPREHPEGHGTT
jgi:Domain of unknown function (DUF4260)